MPAEVLLQSVYSVSALVLAEIGEIRQVIEPAVFQNITILNSLNCWIITEYKIKQLSKHNLNACKLWIDDMHRLCGSAWIMFHCTSIHKCYHISWLKAIWNSYPAHPLLRLQNNSPGGFTPPAW